jgi:hypothetical protein
MVSVEVSMRYTITLQHKSVEPKDWARIHCKSFLSCTLHGTFGDDASLFMDYHFFDDKDAFWFRMRWE